MNLATSTYERVFFYLKVYLHPTNMTHIVKIFSASVFGATFPKPTDVSEVKVKYSAVTYRDFKFVVVVVDGDARFQQQQDRMERDWERAR